MAEVKSLVPQLLHTDAPKDNQQIATPMPRHWLEQVNHSLAEEKSEST